MPVPPSSTSVLPPAVATTLFWAAVAACAVAQGFILRAAFRATPPSPAASAVPAPRRAWEVVWALLPAAGLVAVWLGAWRVLPS